MKEHNYNIRIPAVLEKEADEKIAALAILASQLTAKELTKLAHIVKTDPVKTALAKKYLGV
ncbi:hypothetical protein GGD38_002523 [Chitinophagaceae bacterium OAS944]|jgi:hypothetical protein|uniref:hypothetical protein n=1 Tax=Niastella sp. OAS944 TaxID=2664089 RepID=UPI0035C843D9|nr:hypothetical protein [Chitinophagaceae bacterium OAS944]